MIGNIVARRYAGALFAIGKKKGADELAAFGKDLSALVEALEAAPDLKKVFRNPIFSVEEKKQVIGKVLDSMSPTATVRNFCFLLADKKRLPYLGDIASVFASYLDAEQGVLRGEVVTAIALSEAKQGDVKNKLESQAGRSLVLDFSTDASILGGLILKVGDRVMDASLRAQLGILKENIKRGE
ncbi:MAG: ATP synthase F1 subunit delta [Desulfovibrionaceae bacterium]